MRLQSPVPVTIAEGQVLAVVCGPEPVAQNIRKAGLAERVEVTPALATLSASASTAGLRAVAGAVPVTSEFPGTHLVVETPPLPNVGAVMSRPGDPGGLLVVGKFRWPGSGPGRPSREGCWVQARQALYVEPGGHAWVVTKCGFSLAWITLSDKGYVGGREDQAGPLIAQLVDNNRGGPLLVAHAQGFLLPDDPKRLRALLTELALEQGYDLLVTTGGTGVAPRDTTPETTLAVIEKRLPGMEAAMLQTSLRKTPHAVISRAVVGILGQSLIINLPGSPKAVRENLEALLPALEHTLAKLHGDSTDCATPPSFSA
ncbi:MogA/MoaB family molybdenum cofactor biosynthesis protein [Desulfonatronum thioautotrophicum]|uniref:MogA/MoaB family molybdenum cofactor biosynthesis protein n=1 Tax=Desulfonatronum thioautotrophicum TaxID=617001 RepID=UPI001427BD83|nr:MogA/MoaB family molybdenum cofactor biosynthesis protein [Desulfonatronum thioautotrophicum]